jgi:3-deoxy-D-manno-octulosonic-acid transferase
VDTPLAVRNFLDHWRPDVALFVDSELWPNLVMETKKRRVRMGMVNARLSQRSFRRWQRLKPFIRELLSGFTLCFAQSEADGERLRALGMPAAIHIGNLKYDAPPLPCDESELARLRAQATGRSIWVAASTHPGEEASIAAVHAALKAEGGRPLTIIVPRHAARGDDVAVELAPLAVARRSKREHILPETDIYLADTMGELGLFYRLASIAFIGGTLVAHGGQNPLEAARLGCAVLAGPHMENFAAIAAAMDAEGAIVRVEDARMLEKELKRLLPDGGARAQLAAAAQAHVRSGGGALGAITEELRRYLA